jgi:5-bromo-4-chloroindolyl phosphate hydrolysis protein
MNIRTIPTKVRDALKTRKFKVTIAWILGIIVVIKLGILPILILTLMILLSVCVIVAGLPPVQKYMRDTQGNVPQPRHW